MDSNTNITFTELWKTLSILNCIEILVVASSIKELKQSTLNRSWENLRPEGILKDSVVPPLNFEISRLLNMGHRFSGEGFDDMTADNINEIIYEAVDFNEEKLILLATGSQTTSNIAHENEDSDPEEDICESIPDFTLNRIRECFNLAGRLKSFYFR